MSRVFTGTAGNFLSSAITTSATIPAYTIAVWAKFTTESASTRAIWGIDSNGNAPHLRKFDDGTQDLTVSQKNGIFGGQAANLTVLNAWQHYVAVLSGTTSTLYVDGVNVGDFTGTPEGILTAITQFRLGLLTNGADPYLGKIGRTSGWARALTAGEISALAAGGLPSAADATARWFDYDPDTLTNQFTPAAGLTAGALVVTGSVPVDGADNPPIGPAPATNLQFEVQPVNTVVGQAIPDFVVAARNGSNALDTNYTGNVTVSLQNGALTGTLVRAAVGGLATFPGVGSNTLQTGAVMNANGGGLTQGSSAPFNFTAGGGQPNNSCMFLTDASSFGTAIAAAPLAWAIRRRQQMAKEQRSRSVLEWLRGEK